MFFPEPGRTDNFRDGRTICLIHFLVFLYFLMNIENIIQKALVKTLAKNLVKNLAKHLVKKLSKIWG